MTQAPRAVNIVGAGLAGALLALLLARRGLRVALFERRADPRQAQPERGRSINLALAARGLRALERAGVLAQVQPLLIPMRGRMVHERSGRAALQPYGQREHEVIYSVGRADLNRVLIDAAARHGGVSVRFGQSCLGADSAASRLRFRGEGGEYSVPLAPTLATDGAGSAVRASLAAAGLVKVREEWLDHDYKELSISPAAGAALERHALHIWPRGGFMLIALPNTDGSFTATLFLPRSGAPSFATLDGTAAVTEFFGREFHDTLALLPDLAAQFAAHPQGQLGTVHTTPWHRGGEVLLLGDAAHAIVPFHGQGMNAAFEDCTQLDELLDSHGADWAAAFAALEAARAPNAAAIARMALENYAEMRAAVLDEGFVRRRTLALELERRFPERFIPRYSMVMFHPEIPYTEALRRGAVQDAAAARARCGSRRATGPRARGRAGDDAARAAVEAKVPGQLCIRRLTACCDRELAALSDVLIDCVAGGASVSFMPPLTPQRASTFWRSVCASAACGERVLLVAEDGRRRHRRHGASDPRPAGEPAASRRDRQDAGASSRPPPGCRRGAARRRRAGGPRRRTARCWCWIPPAAMPSGCTPATAGSAADRSPVTRCSPTAVPAPPPSSSSHSSGPDSLLRGGESAAHRRQLVAVGVAHVGGVEIRVVVRAQAGRTFARALVRERRRVKALDLAPRACAQRHHGAVAGARRTAVERRAQPQRQLGRAAALIRTPATPARRLPLRGYLAAPVTQCAEHRVVETRRALRVVGAEADVGEHGGRGATGSSVMTRRLGGVAALEGHERDG